MKILPVAKIENDFNDKFGVPRQSHLINEIQSKIIFEKEFSDANAVRGLDGYSHIWLIWEFDKNKSNTARLTVRPPRLGGNKRMGVFATRSPFRPNRLGLSSVRLERIEYDENNHPVLIVSGADLVSGTPIYDIKPYIKFSDSHPDAVSGFADEMKEYHIDKVISPEEILSKIGNKEKQKALIKILESDPRPAYQNDENRIYGLKFAGHEVKFRVKEKTIILVSIENE